MGQTLSEPITTKESASCANKQFSVGSSCMQGWRTSMEDAHTHLLSLPDDPSTAFFAVYDGHGGDKVSQYAGIHLHKNIVHQPSYKEGNMPDAIKKGFLSLDDKMRADEDMKDDMSGTTAVVVIVNNETAYCGNVGDSRAVVSVCGEAVPLSYDHKPANESEAQRIVAAGGWVEFNRVNGNLALSRALGDFVFKKNENVSAEKQVVTAFPDVITEKLTDEHEFIVLACDGIWDVMSNQEVVDFCRDRLAAGREPQVICEELLTRCLAPDCQMGGLGCDNMTVVLVCLTRGTDAEAYSAKCARPSRVPLGADMEMGNGEQYQFDDMSAGGGDALAPSSVIDGPSSISTNANRAPVPAPVPVPTAASIAAAAVKGAALAGAAAPPPSVSVSAEPSSDAVSSPTDSFHTPQPSPHPMNTDVDDDERPPNEFSA